LTSLCGLNWRVETCVVVVNDLLEAVEKLEVGVGAASFGMVPDVKAVGDDGTILGGEGNDDEECVGAADVLALGTLIFGSGTTAGVTVGSGVNLAAGASCAWTGEA
jgi:hypothetical protein